MSALSINPVCQKAYDEIKPVVNKLNKEIDSQNFRTTLKVVAATAFLFFCLSATFLSVGYLISMGGMINFISASALLGVSAGLHIGLMPKLFEKINNAIQEKIHDLNEQMQKALAHFSPLVKKSLWINQIYMSGNKIPSFNLDPLDKVNQRFPVTKKGWFGKEYEVPSPTIYL